MILLLLNPTLTDFTAAKLRTGSVGTSTSGLTGVNGFAGSVIVAIFLIATTPVRLSATFTLKVTTLVWPTGTLITQFRVFPVKIPALSAVPAT